MMTFALILRIALPALVIYWAVRLAISHSNRKHSEEQEQENDFFDLLK